jgi:DNA polymerase-3 subunit epsilon/oligoribonuclease
MLAIFLDIETTGLDFFIHRTIDFALKIIDVSTGIEKFTYQSVVKQPLSVWEKRDPSSVEINGFTWEKLLSGLEEERVKKEIIQIFIDQGITRGRAVYVCQNPAFDKGFFSQIIDVHTQEELNWPYHWLDFASMFWALRMKQANQNHETFPIEINLSKNAIAEYYHLPVETIPHSALNGVNHLILCYRTVIGFSHIPVPPEPPLIKYDE